MPDKMHARAVWPLMKRTAGEWSEDKVPKMAAALAYYTAIAIAPLLIILIKVIGVVLGPRAAADQLRGQLAQFTDPQIASALQEAIQKAGEPGSGTVATIISVIIALFGASGVFGELQDSLNTVWEVRPRADRGIMGIIRDRFLSMTMVLGSAFLLLVSMFVSSIITGVSGSLIAHTIGADGMSAKVIAFVIDFGLSTAVVTVLFAAIFRVLPDVKIAWKDVWLGAFVTALLFQIGKYGLSLYLAKASPASAYGVAGSIVAVLVWVYYSAQILYFGAEFTQVYANQYGTRIVPSANAEPLTEEMRRQAGVPHEQPKSIAAAAHASPAAAGKAKPASRRRRQRVRPHPITVGLMARDRHSYIARYLPVLAGMVIGRFAWMRYHDVQPAGEPLRKQWGEAAAKWKKLAKFFVSDRARRYTMTHGPAGQRGTTWSELLKAKPGEPRP